MLQITYQTTDKKSGITYTHTFEQTHQNLWVYEKKAYPDKNNLENVERLDGGLIDDYRKKEIEIELLEKRLNWKVTMRNI